MKILKWQLRACMAQFLGFSRNHSSLVGLVCNLQTNYVTPQYHVMYDQCFDTVYGGLQVRTIEQLDKDKLQIYLRSKWGTDDHVNMLSKWDTLIDGPLPDMPLLWNDEEDTIPIVPLMPPASSAVSLPLPSP